MQAVDSIAGGQNGPRPYSGKVVLATPFYNLQAWSPYVQSLLQTVQVLDRMKISHEFWPIHGDSYVQRARNTICAKFMESDATDLFFIDSDESWDVISFLRVLLAPFAIVGASYKMKNNWEAWTATIKMDGTTPLGKLMPNGQAFLKAQFLPAGFLRIKKEALEAFMLAYPQLKYRDEGSEGKPGREYFSFFECSLQDEVFHGEDTTFCKRWRDIGGELWIEPRASITHYGVQGWEGNLDESLRKNHKEAA